MIFVTSDVFQVQAVGAVGNEPFFLILFPPTLFDSQNFEKVSRSYVLRFFKHKRLNLGIETLSSQSKVLLSNQKVEFAKQSAFVETWSVWGSES